MTQSTSGFGQNYHSIFFIKPTFIFIFNLEKAYDGRKWVITLGVILNLQHACWYCYCFISSDTLDKLTTNTLSISQRTYIRQIKCMSYIVPSQIYKGCWMFECLSLIHMCSVWNRKKKPDFLPSIDSWYRPGHHYSIRYIIVFHRTILSTTSCDKNKRIFFIMCNQHLPENDPFILMSAIYQDNYHYFHSSLTTVFVLVRWNMFI